MKLGTFTDHSKCSLNARGMSLDKLILIYRLLHNTYCNRALVSLSHKNEGKYIFLVIMEIICRPSTELSVGLPEGAHWWEDEATSSKQPLTSKDICLWPSLKLEDPAELASALYVCSLASPWLDTWGMWGRGTSESLALQLCVCEVFALSLWSGIPGWQTYNNSLLLYMHNNLFDKHLGKSLHYSEPQLSHL